MRDGFTPSQRISGMVGPPRLKLPVGYKIGRLDTSFDRFWEFFA